MATNAPIPKRDLMRIAVIERHGKNSNIATGFIQGFWHQAREPSPRTVCHDHHNIAVVGADYDDMALAANRLSRDRRRLRRRPVDGKILAELACPSQADEPRTIRGCPATVWL